nr:uncharacterized GPI-anchored protein At1g61900-like isoform X2 [Ipomoea batatas]
MNISETTGFHESLCTSDVGALAFDLYNIEADESLRSISPSLAPQPLVPLQAPSALRPYIYNGVPKLSGHCPLKFSEADSIFSITAIDCWSSLAPYSASAVCCPQLDASLVILIGHTSKQTQKLSLGETEAKHCLSDVEQILESRGASNNLHEICSISPSNLTASCPVVDINDVESILDSPSLLAACGKIDPTGECCNQVCQNTISAAAGKLAFRNKSVASVSEIPILLEKSSIFRDCKKIVLRWLASKLDSSSTNRILRALASCDINKACPLVFPDVKNVSRQCGGKKDNHTPCCDSMKSYLSHLQQQSLITSLQALECAEILGRKLQKANVTNDIFSLCHVNLKDFSLQALSVDSGCLLPSAPLDLAYDNTSGIGFICDLNDKVVAPWSAASYIPTSSCNKTTALPELPKATSAQKGKGLCFKDMSYSLFFASSMIIQLAF